MAIAYRLMHWARSLFTGKFARKRTLKAWSVGPEPEFGPVVPMNVGPRSFAQVVADQRDLIIVRHPNTERLY